MSTKKTRAFLEYYVQNAAGTPAAAKAREALAEVEAIETARQERADLAEAIAEGDTAALERLAQLACDERNAMVRS